MAGGRHLARVVTHTGIGAPAAPEEQYGTSYFHTDLVGSIQAVTDASGEVVASYKYEPFGLTVRANGVFAGRKACPIPYSARSWRELACRNQREA